MGFYHVETEDGVQGWASTRYVRVSPPPLNHLPGITGAPSPASAISESWNKPTPNKTTFTGPDGTCPWNGNNTDADTFLRKKSHRHSCRSPISTTWTGPLSTI